jgi:exonuclease III
MAENNDTMKAMATSGGRVSPRPFGSQRAPGEEVLHIRSDAPDSRETTEGLRTSAARGDEGAGSKPKGSSVPDGSGVEDNVRPVQERKRVRMRVGTWNVLTMNEMGKWENVKEEMRRNRLHVLGLSEVRWKVGGEFESGGYKIMYAGGKECQRGVAIVLDRDMAKRVIGVERYSDRLMTVKVKAEPVDITYVQVYMPTSTHGDQEVEAMYEQLSRVIDKQKGKEYLVVMGDWNAVVGEGRDGLEVGNFGLGKKNERGERLIEFCRRHKLVITNTWFENEKRRRYTWKAPGDRERYQIDYIMVRQRYRNSVKNAKSYPGADVNSDHNLVAMSTDIKLKKIMKRGNKKKWNMEKFKANGNAFREGVEGAVREGEGGTSEERWDRLKQAVKGSAMEYVGFKKGGEAKKPWVTEGMLMKMRERRKWKSQNTDEGKKKYKQLNNELRRETEEAREIWWENECEQLEELEKKGRSDLMYAKVRKLTSNNRSFGSAVINDSSGHLLTEENNVLGRWKEYIEVLYDGSGKPSKGEMGIEDEEDVKEECKGPDVLRSEVLAAIKDLKKNKAAGVDDIPSEFLQALGEKGEKEMVELCVEMYREGEWPEDFNKVVMIPLQKKANAVECADHRTISLICHASKVMLKILTKRIEGRVKDFLGRNQFGFRKGCGTRDAIGVVRTLCDRSLEYGNDVYICFVDFEKAFDRVNWVKMMSILKDLQVDWRDRKLISDLYLRQEMVVRIAGKESEPGIVGRGVRQGCPLSPLLFTIYAEVMMVEAMEGVEDGVRVGGEMVQDVRFADDQAMASGEEEGLQRIMNRLNETAKKYDMKINVKKTKVMVVSKDEGKTINITIDGQRVEQVKSFRYLGSLISEDGRCINEVKARIGMAKDAFNKMRELLTKKMKTKVKKRIIKTVIWPVAMYGCETWIMNKEECDRLYALEMWLWRRMEKVSWEDGKTNEEVLRDVGEGRCFMEAIVRRKKNWIGHVLRGESLLRQVLEGRMEGERGKGRPRFGMVTDLMEKKRNKKDNPYANMKRKAEDREAWRSWMPRTCLRTEN